MKCSPGYVQLDSDYIDVEAEIDCGDQLIQLAYRVITPCRAVAS